MFIVQDTSLLKLLVTSYRRFVILYRFFSSLYAHYDPDYEC